MTILDIAREYGDPVAISKERYEEAKKSLDSDTFRSQCFVQDGAYFHLGPTFREDASLLLLYSVNKKLKMISLYAGIMVAALALSVLLGIISAFT